MNIRIDELNIKNFVGIGSGTIKVNFDNSDDTPNVVGIFGANGTGKTRTLNVIKVIQKLLNKKQIPRKLSSLQNDTTLTVKFTFTDNVCYNILYSIIYNRNEIKSEYLFKDNDLIIGYHDNNFEGVLADTFSERIKGLILGDLNGLESFIFNSRLLTYLELSDFCEKDCVLSLNSFAKDKMIFIDAEEVYNGKLIVNVGRLLSNNDEYFNLIEDLNLNNDDALLIKKSFLKINPILQKFVNRRLELLNVGEGLYITAVYNGVNSIHIKNESLGIRRFILYIYSFMLLRNDKSICLCIDEIDSGIFEPLLRELVLSIKTIYAGQLWFTAHNFELVSALNANDVVFTTMNSEDRFMRLDTVKVLHDIYDKIEDGFYGEFDESEIDYLMRGSHV